MNSILEQFKDCEDLEHEFVSDLNLHLLFFAYLTDDFSFEQKITRPFFDHHSNKEALSDILKRSIYVPCSDLKEAVRKILEGHVAIFFEDTLYLTDVFGPQTRAIEKSERETTIVGSLEAFNESNVTNLSLIRRRLKSSDLKVLKLSAGEITKTDVLILYLENIANKVFVEKLTERIKSVNTDYVLDSNMFVQLIDDNPYSLFPQFLTTERPELATSKLALGKVIGLVEGSPSTFIAPTNFFEFFQSPDDISQRWGLGTATKILRYIAFFITLTFTALYVAVTTFHYEMIPETLLISLAESRNRVPFPPLIEAFIMEFTIELLREAGARLPAKIGQTIGIVGGIVIGQAAVDAGLVSNTLIIAVAISAISSFVMPNYLLSAALRVARFGLIVLAGVLGNLGLTIGIAFLVIHLSKLTNLDSSYLLPVAPNYFRDWKSAFIRAPFSEITKRPAQSVSQNVRKHRMKK